MVNGTVHGLVGRWALRSPDAVALRCGEDSVDYRTLDASAARLARRLVVSGIGRGDVVCVLMERSIAFVVAALAVLKAGAAYAMVDPDLPPSRVRTILDDTRAAAVVTTFAAQAVLPAAPGEAAPRRILVDADIDADVNPDADVDMDTVVGPEDAACVMFTSGSTGRPKGVLAPHRAIVRAVTAREYCDIGVGTVVLQASQISWDVFAQELWGALVNGATCVLLPGQRPDPERIEDAVARYGVTVVYLAASLFNHLVDEHPAVPAGVRQVMTGGEPLSVGHVRRALAANPGLRLVNGYGPVETMILSTFQPVTAAEAERPAIAIGTAFPGDEVYLLDEALRPVPDGAVGEIYVGGHGLAHGYIAQPARTGERFVANPWGGPGSRMYRTGDLARRRPDGALEYLGRGDDQVKIRGMRIEPGEAEAAVIAHPAVAQCAVAAREIGPGARALVAYVVLEPGGDTSTLRDHCRDRLPDHLVPQLFLPLPALPITATGKLDRAALPDPDPAARAPSRAPETAGERLLCTLFEKLLGRAEVGAEEGFFELGGHSLTAMRLVSEIRARLGREVELRTVFEAPTPAALSLRLERHTADRPALTRREPRPATVPLAAAQRRLWFLDEAGPTAAYSLPVLIRVRGRLDTDALRSAVRDVVTRHEVLRTVYPAVDGEPCQRIGESGPELEIVPAVDEAAIEEYCRRTFALREEPPLRVAAFTDGAGDHAIALVLHHIAGDGWSLRPLLRDLGEAYRARLAGGPPLLPPLPVQYADFTLWQLDRLDTAESQLSYWAGTLRDAPDELPLPTDRRRTPDVGVGPGADVVRARVPAAEHALVVDAARAVGGTLFTALHAAVAALCTRLGAGTDIPLGTVTAGRADPALDEAVGFFVNTLVLRTDTAGDPSFGELMRRSHEVELDAFTHQDVPFDLVVGRLNPERVPGRHPLFQTMVVLQNNIHAHLTLPGASVDVSTPKTGVAKADLVFEITEGRDSDGTPGGLGLELEYVTGLFDRATARFLADAFLRLLVSGCGRPSAPVSTLPLLSEPERHRSLTSWAGTRRPDDDGPTVVDMFRRNADAYPDHDAVVCGPVRLGYAELDDRCARLARRLRACGVRSETVVAVCLPRRAEVAEAFLGVLRAGGAYLPLDPGDPVARHELVVADAGVRLVLAVRETAEHAGRLGLPVLLLDDADTPDPDVPDTRSSPPGSDPRPTNAAYLIYTSGSTGRPKGVVVEHRALANLATAQRTRFATGPRDRVLQWSSFTFDMSVWDLTMALTSGAALHVVGDDERVGAELESAIDRAGITVGMIAPAAAASLPGGAGALPGMRTLLVGGEGFGASLVERWAPGRRFVNAYGPTEAAVAVTTADLVPGDPVVVGTALPGVGVHVLDERLEPMPPGVVGEVYAVGAALARGYANRRALTAERFVADPHGAPGTRMYRTGDLGRMRRDGRLEVVGRVDHQVKLRGFRIELGEIEAALAAHPAVGHAAAAVHREPSGPTGGETARLAAYVAVGRDVVSDDELRRWVAERLPRYMVPSVFVRLDALPTTAAGKVDRAALPAPAASDAEDHDAPDADAAARTPTEAVLCRVWSEELAVARVGATDDYFRLGGDSLTAVRVAARVQRETGRAVGAAQVLRTPTVRALAEHLDALPAGTGPGPGAPIRRQPRNPRHGATRRET